MKRLALMTMVALLFGAPAGLSAQERGSGALSQQVSAIGATMRVLIVGAHPDDEDTQLISWLSHGQHAETAYLSLTRGDGGQNLIGNELGEALGVIRTAELMSARRIDGARQYFTRAYDFGFSKDTIDTFRHWPRDSLLRDVVRVVRDFAPHVIVAVFSGTARDGHGQHQVSAILAKEVWTAAGDTVRFPVNRFGPGWTPLKLYRGARFSPGEGTLRINVGEYNPLLGKSYAEIAAESRSQHKSQGFGTLQRKGVVWDWLRREESRVAAPAEAKDEKSMFDGIDTSLSRLANAAAGPRCSDYTSLVKSVAGAISTIPPVSRDHRPVIAVLARLKRLLPGRIDEVLSDGAPCGRDKRDAVRTFEVLHERVNRALISATNLTFEAFVSRKATALGDTFTVTSTIYNRGNASVGIRGGVTGNGRATILLPDSSAETRLLWNDATLDGRSVQPPGTQPTWLRAQRHGDLFGSTQNPMDVLRPGLEIVRASMEVEIDSAVVNLSAPVSFRFADPVVGDVQRPFAVGPGIAINFDRQTELARAGKSRTRFFNVTIRSAYPSQRDVTVQLNVPRGLKADAASRTVSVGPNGTRTVTFRVSGALQAGDFAVSATANSEGKSFAVGYVPIEYEHIPPQRMYRAASVSIAAIPVIVPAGLNVAYVRGVGDNVPATLQDLGIPVTMVAPAELPLIDLSRFSTTIVGTRAYQASHELIDNNSYLLDYVKRGGTLVAQYGQYEMTLGGLMPYSITLGRPAERVTDETAEVRITDRGSPLLSYPNKVGPADFLDWVQERSSYMPATFDSTYKTLLSLNDPGENAKISGILVAPYGSGLYIYATLAFFRQLPAGNPGATKLFVNLISARQGK